MRELRYPQAGFTNFPHLLAVVEPSLWSHVDSPPGPDPRLQLGQVHALFFRQRPLGNEASLDHDLVRGR